MTITQKIAAAVGGAKAGQHAEQGTHYPAASTLATHGTTSASPAGMMEQAGAGEYRAGNIDHTGAHHLSAVGTGGSHMAGEMVCVPGNVAAPVPVGEKKFIVTEDHAVVKQRVERWVEHQPVEREYRTTVQETGHVSAGATSVEGTTAGERVVNEHTCYPVSQTTIHGVAGESTTNTASAMAADVNRVI